MPCPLHPAGDCPDTAGPFDSATCPRPCWLYAHDPRYRRLWDGVPANPLPTPGKNTRPTLRSESLPKPANGPGTELKNLLGDLGVTDKPNCGCNTAADEMDRLGPAGVRAEAGRFAAALRANAKRMGWLEYAKVVARAVAKGLILDPRDPYTGLVLEACRRAEK